MVIGHTLTACSNRDKRSLTMYFKLYTLLCIKLIGLVIVLGYTRGHGPMVPVRYHGDILVPLSENH